jgi:hypothetical protein
MMKEGRFSCCGIFERSDGSGSISNVFGTVLGWSGMNIIASCSLVNMIVTKIEAKKKED